jgi:thiol-disulfide isomerase/thioredoxin
MNTSLARRSPLLRVALLAALGAFSLLVPSLLAAESARLALGGPAPELTGDAWLNLPTGTGPTLASRKGRVTIVHFWTYGCINCRRNLPIYDRWQQRYTGRGALVIGIHTPETDAETKPANVVRKVKELGITYPVLLDARRYNWNRWRQHAWPTVYLVDKQGRARYLAEGELGSKGGEGKMSQLIESLLRE